jgi:hypothetical protein
MSQRSNWTPDQSGCVGGVLVFEMKSIVQRRGCTFAMPIGPNRINEFIRCTSVQGDSLAIRFEFGVDVFYNFYWRYCWHCGKVGLGLINRCVSTPRPVQFVDSRILGFGKSPVK